MREQISLKNIPEEAQKEILRKNWQATDGRWQYAMFSALGTQKGNEINQEVAKSVHKGAMYRLLNAFNKNKVSDAEEFYAIMIAAMDLFHAHTDFKYQFERISPFCFRGIVMKCGTNDSVRKAGVLNLYECGCFSCRAGWYEAMGLKVEEKCEKCLLRGDDACEIAITVKDWE